MQDRGTPTI